MGSFVIVAYAGNNGTSPSGREIAFFRSLKNSFFRYRELRIEYMKRITAYISLVPVFLRVSEREIRVGGNNERTARSFRASFFVA